MSQLGRIPLHRRPTGNKLVKYDRLIDRTREQTGFDGREIRSIRVNHISGCHCQHKRQRLIFQTLPRKTHLRLIHTQREANKYVKLLFKKMQRQVYTVTGRKDDMLSMDVFIQIENI